MTPAASDLDTTSHTQLELPFITTAESAVSSEGPRSPLAQFPAVTSSAVLCHLNLFTLFVIPSHISLLGSGLTKPTNNQEHKMRDQIANSNGSNIELKICTPKTVENPQYEKKKTAAVKT